MDFEVQEVVVVADELSDLAVDVCGQLLGVGVGADDQLGADLHDVSPHGSGPAWPTVAGATGAPRVTPCKGAPHPGQDALLAGYS